MKILFRKNRSIKLVILAMLLIVVVSVSCSDDEKYVEQEEVGVEVINNGLNSFLLSVDSLNNHYSTVESRGSFWGGSGVAMADYVGYACGGSIGRWAGGILGSLTGNPLIGYAGAIIGGKVGPAVCGSLASGIANMLMSCNERTTSVLDLTLKSDLNINLFEENIDSLGLHHNMVMVKIVENADKYGYGKSINKELLYDDIVKYCKELGYYDNELENNVLLKNAILAQMELICDVTIEYESGDISIDQLTQIHEDFLAQKCGFTENELRIFREFTCELALTCAQLDEDVMSAYSSDLNKVIQQSDITFEEKAQIASSAQMIINSSLCWQQ